MSGKGPDRRGGVQGQTPACRREPRLRFGLGRDAQLLEGIRQVLPAGGAARRIGIRDRFGIKHRFLERFDRADVGLCGTLFYCQTDLGAR